MRSLFLLFLFLIPATLISQIILPYKEGFERATDTTYLTNSEIKGISQRDSHWQFETTIQNSGRLRIKAGLGFIASGNKALTMDRLSFGVPVINFIIGTFDLRKSSSATNLELSFSIMDHGDENDSTDKVWVRGSKFDNWVLLYDLLPEQRQNGVYKQVSGLDIDSALKSVIPVQSVSSTFQIRFGQEDNGQANAPGNTDGITIDDVVIKGSSNLSGTDLAVLAIEGFEKPYCSGIQNVEIDIMNTGNKYIDSTTFHWEVNGTPQTPVSFPSLNLPAGVKRTISLGSYNFISNTTYNIGVNCNNTNGLSSDNTPSNDTLEVVGLELGMTGVYTINPSGSGPTNFTSFTAAIASLEQLGICGQVVFNVANGTYAEKFHMSKIRGASSTNTILFKGLNKENCNLSYLPTAEDPPVFFKGTSHITLKNISFNHNQNSSIATMLFSDACNRITIDSCAFLLNGLSFPFNQNIIFTSSFVSSPTVGNNLENITITNCEFDECGSAIKLYGMSASGLSPSSLKGVTIENSNFENSRNAIVITDYRNVVIKSDSIEGYLESKFGSTSIDLARINNLEISGNYIGEKGSIALYSTRDLILSGNDLKSRLGGIFVTGLNNTYLPVSNSLISNNMSGSMRIYGAEFLDLVNNSISSSQTSEIYSSTGLTILNNIFSSITIPLKFTLTNVADIDSMDYNLYFSEYDTNIITFSNVDYKSLSDWRNTFPGLSQLNSAEGNPFYYSNENLHARSSLVHDNGVNLPFVITDIDGDLRPTGLSTDIGADEFNLSTTDMRMVSYIQPSNFCGDSSQSFAFVFQNIGQSPVTSANFVCELSGSTNTSFNKTYSGNLPFLASDTIVFDQGVNTLSGGVYDIKVYHQLPFDVNPEDDTLFFRLTIEPSLEIIPLDTSICKFTNIQVTPTVNKSINIDWYGSKDVADKTIIGVDNITISIGEDDSTIWADESRYGTDAVRFTEVRRIVNYSGFEIQNLGTKAVNVNGWLIAFNNGLDPTEVDPYVETLSGVMNPGALKAFYEGSTGNWPGDIDWTPTNPGWLVLLDNNGIVIDFVVWSFFENQIKALQFVVNGHPVQITNKDWIGKSYFDILPGMGRYNIDANKRTDWFSTGSTLGIQNPNLNLPISGVGRAGCLENRVPYTIRVVKKPKPAFSYNTNSREINLVNQTVEKPAEGPYSYFWTLGDGATSTTRSPLHTYSNFGTYQVKMRVSNACESDSITKNVGVFPNSINEINNTFFRAYPNPTSDVLKVEFYGFNNGESLLLKIIDARGVNVYEQTFVNSQAVPFQLDMAQLPSGIYTILVSNERQFSEQRIVKE